MFKTGLLLAAITALFLMIGFAMGGESGMALALVFALVTNFGAYWFSDTVVLRMYRARPLDPDSNRQLYAMIERLAKNAQIPTPKAYIMDSPQPNAFATGRSPNHAAVAVTTGLLNILSPEEIAGVMAHEMAHIKNRDTLIMTVTATIAGAIGALANFFMFFGGSRDNDRPLGPIAGIVVALLAPMMAMLVQMAISRTREYAADKTGAAIAGDPASLASALRKISDSAARIPNHAAEANPATAHLFIANPLHGRGMDNLFSTHPSTENRIAELMNIASKGEPAATPAPKLARSSMPSSRNPMRRGSFDFTDGQ